MIRPLSRLLPALIISVSIIYAFRRIEGPFSIQIVIPGANVVTDPKPPSSPPYEHVSSAPLAPAHHEQATSLSSPTKDILESIASYLAYEDYQNQIIDRKFSRFSRASQSQRELAKSLGYDSHFVKARDGIYANSVLARKIAKHGREVYGMWGWDVSNVNTDMGLLSEAMGHIVRDWSEVGSFERGRVFPPILDALKSHFGEDVKEDIPKKILVPGFGLGRLAHDIAEIEGLSVTANDIDYTAILAYNFLLNHTSEVFEHAFYPFCTQWTQQRDTNARFQEVKFPDYIPSDRSKSSVTLVEGDFVEAFKDSNGKYDAVVTLFFIDVGESIVDFLERIHSVLKPGGLWINLGPLKWGSFAHMQLSADEVLKLAETIGFDINYDSRKSIETVYAGQPESLLRYTYVTQFWSATKKLEGGRSGEL